MRSIIDALNETYLLVNLTTGDTVEYLGCSGESALLNYVIDKLGNAYLDANPLVFGAYMVRCGEWCTVQYNSK